MSEIPEESGGKLDWRFSLGASIVIHAVVIFLFLLFVGYFTSDSGKSASKDKDSEQSASQNQTQDLGSNREDSPVEPPTDNVRSGRTNQTASRTAVPTPRPTTTPTSRAIASTTQSSSSIAPPQNVSSRVTTSMTATPSSTKSQANSYVEYTVVKGDHLTKIANAHKCTVNEIVKLNKINPKASLFVGKKLKIPVK